MSDLKPLTPLGGDIARLDQIGVLRIAENPNLAIASLAARKGRSADVAQTVKAALQIELPQPGKSRRTATHTVWWMGPDQWMLSAEHNAHELLADEVKAIVGDAASVTEQTDAWCCFEVSAHCEHGPDSSNAALYGLFERLCAVDVRQMVVEDATRTSIHHTGCFLIRKEDGFCVIGPRSSAGSLHHALVEVAGGLG